MVARHRQASPVISQNESHRRLRCQIERGIKTGIIKRFAVKNHRFGRLAGIPRFMAQPGPNHGDRLVEGAESPSQFDDVERRYQ
jgi:hypothetical protein